MNGLGPYQSDASHVRVAKASRILSVKCLGSRECFAVWLIMSGDYPNLTFCFPSRFSHKQTILMIGYKNELPDSAAVGFGKCAAVL